MKTCVIGLGYIGTPLSVLIAESDIEVIGIDKNPDVIERFNHGKTNKCEIDVSRRLKRLVDSRKIVAVQDVPICQNYIVAVPTPLDSRKNPDLSAVDDAIEKILNVIIPQQLIIIESTVPVGTIHKIVRMIRDNYQNLVDNLGNITINIAYCPERILPGNTMFELEKNDRIIGGFTEKCSSKAQKFYSSFLKAPLHLTDAKTAEFVKLAENANRDINIAYANELSMLADEMGVDVYKAIQLANMHPRVNILNPGPGVGGHCIPVDPWFLINDQRNSPSLIRTARAVNDLKPDFVIGKIKIAAKNLKPRCKDLAVSILGITYKENSSDIRQSPSLYIADQVKGFGFKKLIIADPNLDELPEVLVSEATELATDINQIFTTDLVILLVKHDEFDSILARFHSQSSPHVPLFLSFA